MALYKDLSRKKDKATPFGGTIIFLIGIFATIMATKDFLIKNQREESLRLEYEISNILRRTQGRMDRYVSSLIQMRAFLLNSSPPHPQTLASYIHDTEILSRLPGLQGVGLSLFLKRKEMKTMTTKINKFYPDFQIWPIHPKRELYSTISFLYPLDWRNKRALGFDMWNEPIRKKAMKEARDKNQAILSEKVVLVQETQGQTNAGLLLYLPYYKKNEDVSTVEGRKKNVLGFIYSPFRAYQLFEAIFAEDEMILDVEIYEGSTTQKNKLLFDYDFKTKTNSNSLSTTIEIYGRNFTFLFTPQMSFEAQSEKFKALWIFALGLLATLLILLIWLLGRRQIRIANIMALENQRMLKKEREHVAARDEFLSIASHELKTPLTSLKLQAQVIQRAMLRQDVLATSPDKIKSFIKLIDHQTSRLTRLVDDMLDLSRIRTGKLRMERQRLDVSSLVVDVLERLKPQFLEKTGQVPRLDVLSDAQAYWDRFRIEQAITNLLTNALKYGKLKPVHIMISVSQGHARISVTDQGIGIAPENLKKIFERFERAGVSASEVSGLGLGLFITKQIVIAHGGKIKVESEIDHGSTFTIELPLGEAPTSQDAVKEP